MKTIIFAVAGYNLAETGRHLEIARACKDLFKIVFMSYGGPYEHLIEEEGFTLKKMNPRLTDKQLKHIRRALSGETFNTVGYFTAREMRPRVENEIELFKELKPECILTGWCQSVLLSARISGVPLINVLHSTSITEYYQAGLQSIPDRRDFAFLHRLFSEQQINRRISNLVLKLKLPVKPFNNLSKKYGLKEFRNVIDLLEGDYTLLADIPEWVGLPDIRPSLYYVGPLPYKSHGEIPEEIAQIPKDKPIIYFAMGSSGKPEIIADIIRGFRNKPYYVIAPVSAHIKDMNIEIPPNVIVTGFLPAHKVNPMADISVIHGGQNTVMNACLSGTPIVGVGMHAEQQANLDACVRKGFAIRLNKKRMNAAAVLEAIDKLLRDKAAKEKILEFQSELRKWNGPENAARFLNEKFGDGKNTGQQSMSRYEKIRS